MKYLTALLIPSVVHGSAAPRRKFISREVRRLDVAREHPGHARSPTIIEFPDISFRPVLHGLQVSLQVTARILAPVSR